MSSSTLLNRALQYADSRSISLKKDSPLGYGSDGTVWRTTRPSAIKASEREENYRLEVECYQRLRDEKLSRLGGFNIPKLIDYDDAFLVFEMDIVRPPYLLDFGKVYLDYPPNYWSDKLYMENVYAEWRDRFEERWPDVAILLHQLQERLGIYYVDPRPGNISFE